MKRFYWFSFFLLFTMTAHAEDVKISTYYPSPEGDYKRIRTTDETNLASNANLSNTARVTVGSVAADASSLMLIRGTGNTDATNALTVMNNNNTQILKARNDGEITIWTPKIVGSAAQPGHVLTAIDNEGHGAWQSPTAYANSSGTVCGGWVNGFYHGGVPVGAMTGGSSWGCVQGSQSTWNNTLACVAPAVAHRINDGAAAGAYLCVNP
jgi:hypothetical protein